MSRFLLKKATENLVIEVGGQELKGRELTGFLEKLIELNGVFTRVDRHFRDARIVDHLLSMDAESRAFLADQQNMKTLAEKVESFGYSAEILTDEEHSVQKLLYRQGSQSPRLAGYPPMSGPEYQPLLVLPKALGSLDQPPFNAQLD